MIVLHHFVFWYVTNSLVHEDEAKKIDLIEQANKSFETTRFLTICKITILIFSRLGVLGPAGSKREKYYLAAMRV